jgi:hypothetical protein
MVLPKNARGHDQTLLDFLSLRGTRLLNSRWHLAGVLARKGTQCSFAGQKDGLVHQLF